MTPIVEELLPGGPSGLVTISPDDVSIGALYYVDGNRFWFVDDLELLRGTADSLSIPIINGQWLTQRSYQGVFTEETIATLAAEDQ